MIPVLVVGLLFWEQVESLFSGNLVLVGGALLVTATLLISTQLVKEGTKKIPYLDAFLMGIAQAAAVIPGISRSGATISTGLLLKNGRSEVAQFLLPDGLVAHCWSCTAGHVSMSSSTEEPGISARGPCARISGCICFRDSGMQLDDPAGEKGKSLLVCTVLCCGGNHFNCFCLI